MEAPVIALLHPGEMGSGVAACAVARGHHVLCALEGRSATTRARARAAGLEDAGSLRAAVSRSAIMLSICPPHGALAMAREVAACGFKGVYVDANAISPQTARAVGAVVEATGAHFVDGGLFGAPPTPGRPVSLVLSGARAAEIAKLFEASCVHARALDAPAGAASTLKACYAAWTKGTWLLLTSIYATAEREGVKAPLRELWRDSHPELLQRLAAPSANPAKAWRWISEMEEIAATFEAAGQPGEFFLACAELCRRLEHYKDHPGKPSIEQVVAALLGQEEQS